MEDPIAEVYAGDLIGELAALAALKQERLKRPKFYPRSATARAKTDVVVLEMLPNILNNVLYNAAAFKDKLNRNYRTRALDSHLRSVPVFKNLSGEFLDYLRERVELVDVAPGQVICKQGEVADSFYMIRLGYVKVSQVFPGGELVLTYLSRGAGGRGSGAGDLQAGRGGGFLLHDPAGIREGLAGFSGRRTGVDVFVAGIVPGGDGTAAAGFPGAGERVEAGAGGGSGGFGGGGDGGACALRRRPGCAVGRIHVARARGDACRRVAAPGDAPGGGEEPDYVPDAPGGYGAGRAGGQLRDRRDHP